MMSTTEAADSPKFIAKAELEQLLSLLKQLGYQVIGPTLQQEAIVYDEISSIDELPRGWTDEQEAGKYRLQRRDDDALFGYVVGPHSWKRFLFPPLATVATADRDARGLADARRPRNDRRDMPFWAFGPANWPPSPCKIASSCKEQYVDPIYQCPARSCLIIAVNCTQAASTCFCTSMGTGPRCTSGFDLALTEIAAADSSSRAAVSSRRSVDLGNDSRSRGQSDELRASRQSARQNAVQQITRQTGYHGYSRPAVANLNHPRWNDVATRCLSCTNCTMVCPTCFCSSVSEVTDLTGDHVERQRQWDSCFNHRFQLYERRRRP